MRTIATPSSAISRTASGIQSILRLDPHGTGQLVEQRVASCGSRLPPVILHRERRRVDLDRRCSVEARQLAAMRPGEAKPRSSLSASFPVVWSRSDRGVGAGHSDRLTVNDRQAPPAPARMARSWHPPVRPVKTTRTRWLMTAASGGRAAPRGRSLEIGTTSFRMSRLWCGAAIVPSCWRPLLCGRDQ